ncbi:MAG: inositol monophosphatase family protein [Calditrichaeota bacterium]|nr:inositol monophosphatase family protein [Calditrichota bacterium]
MYLETAIEAARLGAGILLEHIDSEEKSHVSQKQQFDFVTEVDHLAEKSLIEFIHKRHPKHDILAEESGRQFSDSEFQWIIDPLDGTKNYIHGIPAFAVSVALRKSGEIIAGAISDPSRDEIFYADKGGGAFLNGKAISVTDTTDFSKCLLATGFPFRAKHLIQPYLGAFKVLFERISDFRRAGAAALDLAYVAAGRLDGFWEVGLNIWDIAAGALVVEEAGGKVSDLFGEDSHLNTGNIVASNNRIHEEILEPFAAAFGDILQ